MYCKQQNLLAALKGLFIQFRFECLCLCFIGIYPNAMSGQQGPYSYEIRDHEVVITRCDNTARISSIPAEMEGLPVTTLGMRAFAYNKVRNITIPDSVHVIEKEAFYDCSSLRSISLPEGLTSIAEGTFSSCNELRTISIPNQVSSIGNSAFSGCINLIHITLPETITFIGNEAFALCKSLHNIEIPAKVRTIGINAFYRCQLTSITVDADNEDYRSLDGVLFDKKVATLVKYPALKTGLQYRIPASVTAIATGAFNSCTLLSEITVPPDVITIGEGAFERCSSLESVNIPEGVTEIQDLTFAWCVALSQLSLPNGITRIGDWAFQQCQQLTQIQIPDKVTILGDAAFLGCSSLTEIKLHPGLLSIGENAFRGCSSLYHISIPKTVEMIGDSAFVSCFVENLIDPCVALEWIEIPSLFHTVQQAQRLGLGILYPQNFFLTDTQLSMTIRLDPALTLFINGPTSSHAIIEVADEPGGPWEWWGAASLDPVSHFELRLNPTGRSRFFRAREGCGPEKLNPENIESLPADAL